MKSRWQDDIYEAAMAKKAKANSASKPDVASASAQIIRQSKKEPNKTERRFLNEYLNIWKHEGRIDEIGEHESITLRLANGSRYSPDWPNWKDGRLTFYEVKGAFIREDAIKAIKSAANKYRHCGFVLYQYAGGEWAFQEVLP